MAASTFVPARSTSTVSRAVVAAAAARTAPRGDGLAPVVALPIKGRGAAEADLEPGLELDLSVAPAPALRVVAGRPGRSVRRVRLLATLAVAVGLTLGAVVGGAIMPGPGELDVAGHVVLQPGETLWDVAVRSAPAGVDPRRQLEDIRRVNGFGPGTHAAWTVVLIPGR